MSLRNEFNMAQQETGRRSRGARLREEHSGAWASSSQDFVHLANVLYEQSAEYAARYDGNVSMFALAGIPMLLSALRCLLIELNGGLHGDLRPEILSALASSANDVDVVLKFYTVSDELQDDLRLLLEVRHEILHPAHRPIEQSHGTPMCLSRLRAERILQSTGQESDYVWISQLQSHRLFTWAFSVIDRCVHVLLAAHELSDFADWGLKETYGRYRGSAGDDQP